MKEYKLQELTKIFGDEDRALRDAIGANMAAITSVAQLIGQAFPMVSEALRATVSMHESSVVGALFKNLTSEAVLSGSGPNGSKLKKYIETALYMAETSEEHDHWLQKLNNYKNQFVFTTTDPQLRVELENLLKDIRAAAEEGHKFKIELPCSDSGPYHDRLGIRVVTDTYGYHNIEYMHPLEGFWFSANGVYAINTFSRLLPIVTKLFEEAGLSKSVDTDAMDKIQDILIKNGLSGIRLIDSPQNASYGALDIDFQLYQQHVEAQIDTITEPVSRDYYTRNVRVCRRCGGWDYINDAHPFKMNSMLNKLLKKAEQIKSKEISDADPADQKP